MNPTRITSILRPVLWVGMLLFALTGVTLHAQKKVPPTTQHHLRILHTTDVHGNIFPYDFLNDRAGTGSMSRLSTVLREIRRTDPETLLLDAGDLLQGEPPTYFYNYVDTLSPHIVSSAMNYLGTASSTSGQRNVSSPSSLPISFQRRPGSLTSSPTMSSPVQVSVLPSLASPRQPSRSGCLHICGKAFASTIF